MVAGYIGCGASESVVGTLSNSSPFHFEIVCDKECGALVATFGTNDKRNCGEINFPVR